jgi:hypothetical protein
MQRYTVYLYLETALNVSGGTSTHHQERIQRIYSIWYLSHRYCYLPLSWKSWNWFECAVGGVRHPQHSQTGSNSSTIAADSSNGVTNTRCCRYVVCAPDDGWKYHPKHVEQFPGINKLCNVASLLDIYWNILTIHVPIKVKSPNNISEWQMEFISAFKGLIKLRDIFTCTGIYTTVVQRGHIFLYDEIYIKSNRVCPEK